MRLHLPTARKSSLHSLHRVILEFLCSLCANSCHHRPCADAIFVGDLQQAKGLTELDDILKLVVTSHALERLVDFSQEGMMAAEMDVQAFVFCTRHMFSVAKCRQAAVARSPRQAGNNGS